MHFAPNLYKLAWRKQRTVQEELPNHNWTRGLWRMTTLQEMSEFVVLWDLVQNALTDQEDSIRWRWTAEGQYTAKSAYLVQLQGTVTTVQGNNIWRAYAEGKLKFFAWLLVQSKLLTADNLLARSWPCSETCVLCDQELETATHICLHCSYAKQIWFLVSNWWMAS